jgi:4-hydroxy 2-oxovalerate aldolase
MMSDKRYNDEDILGVIDYLSKNNGKKFEFDSLNIASQFYHDAPKGKWIPETLIKNREVLILGPGPGVSDHKIALENFIKSKKLLVLALNIQKDINPLLINFFIASHPVKILADAEKHSKFSQPLILPVSMLPKKLIKKLGNKKLLDYGIEIKPGKFEFYKNYSITPNSLVLSYALAVCVSGKASKVFMAGFDGYENGDLRNNEIEETLNIFYDSGIPNIKKLIISVTPTRFKGLRSKSIYGFQ